MFSIAAHGHVNPSLEVIRELVARGHRVTYAIPPVFAEKVAATGAEVKPWHSTLPAPDDDPSAWGSTLLDNVEPFLADAIQALPQLIEAYDGDEPDLVLHDITAYPARVLAHRWGVAGDLPLAQPGRLGGLRGGDRRTDVGGAEGNRARKGLLRTVPRLAGGERDRRASRFLRSAARPVPSC